LGTEAEVRVIGPGKGGENYKGRVGCFIFFHSILGLVARVKSFRPSLALVNS
jgi:hypothetical protein